jgi:hypothetical protein
MRKREARSARDHTGFRPALDASTMALKVLYGNRNSHLYLTRCIIRIKAVHGFSNFQLCKHDRRHVIQTRTSRLCSGKRVNNRDFQNILVVRLPTTNCPAFFDFEFCSTNSHSHLRAIAIPRPLRRSVNLRYRQKEKPPRPIEAKWIEIEVEIEG